MDCKSQSVALCSVRTKI